MRDIGLHLRLNESLQALANRALALDLKTFQCFFLHQKTMRFIRPSAQEVAAFLDVRQNFNKLYAHASYWINLASSADVSLRPLEIELDLSKRLQFDALIVHPGCTKDSPDHTAGIDMFVRRLNAILKNEHDINIVLENTAHGKRSIGSDLDDFRFILEKADYPEKISFCIDTAHAHAYGYELNSPEGRELFYAKVENTIGFERVALLHINNTYGDAGSLLDRHALLDKGSIELAALKAFVLHSKLLEVPVIMELPETEHAVEREHMLLVNGWYEKGESLIIKPEELSIIQNAK